MTETLQNRETIAWKTWIAIRFIVFGVGGFVTLWISWLSLIFANDPPSERWLSPYVAAPLSLVGAVMMLYGGGQWGRWAYLWVLVSVPIVVWPLGMLAAAHPSLDFMFAKPLALVLIVLPMVGSYLLAKRYYKHEKGKNLGQ